MKESVERLERFLAGAWASHLWKTTTVVFLGALSTGLYGIDSATSRAAELTISFETLQRRLNEFTSAGELNSAIFEAMLATSELKAYRLRAVAAEHSARNTPSSAALADEIRANDMARVRKCTQHIQTATDLLAGSTITDATLSQYKPGVLEALEDRKRELDDTFAVVRKGPDNVGVRAVSVKNEAQVSGWIDAVASFGSSVLADSQAHEANRMILGRWIGITLTCWAYVLVFASVAGTKAAAAMWSPNTSAAPPEQVKRKGPPSTKGQTLKPGHRR
jgi:hypothetical protein